MRKRKDKQPDISALEPQAAPPDTMTPAVEIETPKIDAPKSETTETDTAVIDTQTSVNAPPASEFAATLAICPQIADAPSIAPPSDEVLKAEIAKVMSSTYEPAIADNVTPITHALNAQARHRFSFRQIRARRLVRLAATVAVAASVGAIGGSLSTLAVSGLGTASGESHASISDLTRMDQELATLKSGVESARKTSSTQLARVVERLDRAERAQSEPTAKLAKLSEAVDRLEHSRSATTFTTAGVGAPAIAAPATTAATPAPAVATTAAANPASANDVTGSIPTRSAAPQQNEANATLRLPVVEGWTLRNVYDGIALVQGRFGLIEIEPGDMVPGIGRIDNIRRQDGRWVVVTSKGLIVAR